MYSSARCLNTQAGQPVSLLSTTVLSHTKRVVLIGLIHDGNVSKNLDGEKLVSSEYHVKGMKRTWLVCLYSPMDRR